jgi:IS30 family transposase
MRDTKRLQDKIVIRTAMMRVGVSLTQLAREIGHHPSVVSKAINHGRFPRVRAKVKEALRAR